jgi:ABC-type dipeptide/oligopeptide/nickel transport system permease component
MTQKIDGASRLVLLLMVSMPAFVLGGAVMLGCVWLGPVAVRDSIIAEYEADTLRLSADLDGERANSMVLMAQLLVLKTGQKPVE